MLEKRAYVGNGYPSSYLLEYGYPQAGPGSAPLLDVPEILSPAPNGPPHPVHAPVEVQFHEPEMDARMLLMRNDVVIWWVYTHGDIDSVTVPHPPSTVDEAQFLGTANISTAMQVIDWKPDEVYLYRMAYSRRFNLIP
jgi:hypothetical protein